MFDTKNVYEIEETKIHCYWYGKLVDRYDDRYMRSQKHRKFFYTSTKFMGVVAHMVAFILFGYIAWFVFNYEYVFATGSYNHLIPLMILLGLMFGSLYLFEGGKKRIAWMCRRHRAKNNPVNSVEYKGATVQAKSSVA